jgi:hypothetical protein
MPYEDPLFGKYGHISVSDPDSIKSVDPYLDPESGSESRRAKMTHIATVALAFLPGFRQYLKKHSYRSC